MVRLQDERFERRVSTDGTKRASVMATCPIEREKHFMLNPDRFDEYPNKAAIGDDVA